MVVLRNSKTHVSRENELATALNNLSLFLLKKAYSGHSFSLSWMRVEFRNRPQMDEFWSLIIVFVEAQRVSLWALEAHLKSLYDAYLQRPTFRVILILGLPTGLVRTEVRRSHRKPRIHYGGIHELRFSEPYRLRLREAIYPNPCVWN